MSNLWLWFENSEERRSYVEQLLDLDPSPKNPTESEQQQQYLDSQDAGKTRGAWFGLEKEFYLGQEKPHHHLQPFPFQEYHVWKKGFRRIYTQKSYQFRPGHWLVLKFRNSKPGVAAREKVVATFPAEHMGTNVPLPERSKAFLNMRVLRRNIPIFPQVSLTLNRRLYHLKEMNHYMAKIYRNYPEFFLPADVYLWEDMAYYWFRMIGTRQADFCCRNQAEMQPDSTGPWLNLGFYYNYHKDPTRAILAYLEGLARDPHDKYINHNLEELLNGKPLPNLEPLLETERISPCCRRLLPAITCRLTGDTRQTLKHYLDAIPLVENDLEISRILAGAAEMYTEMGQRKEAQRCIEKISKLKKTSQYALGVVIRFMAQAGEHAQVEECIKSLTDREQDASIFNTITAALSQSGQKRRSRWFAEAARELETEATMSQ